MGTGRALLQTKGKTVLKKTVSCFYPMNAITRKMVPIMGRASS